MHDEKTLNFSAKSLVVTQKPVLINRDINMSAKNNNKFNKTKNRSNLRIFTGNSHQKLGKDVAKKCGVYLGHVDLKKFANNETSVDLKENVRGQVSSF